MKRPNIHSKPLSGVRTESYHPSETYNNQYAADLNKYCDYLEGEIKKLSSNTVLYAKQQSELAFDAGYLKGYSDGADIERFTNHPTKQQYINEAFKD